MNDKTSVYASHILLLLALGLGSPDQNPPVLYEAITSENESQLHLGEHLQLTQYAAKAWSRIIVEIDQEHQTAISEENVNVNIDCLLWQSSFHNATKQWYYHQRDLEGSLTGIYADLEADSDGLNSNDRWLNISKTVISENAELSNSGDYICEVCLYQSEQCYSGTLTLHVIRSLSKENNSALIVEFEEISYSADEGYSSTLYIVTSRMADRDIEVDLLTFDGNATGHDYESVNTTLLFCAGENSIAFQVLIKRDSLAEPTENFEAQLSNPSVGVVIGLASVTNVEIFDQNDLTVSIEHDAYTVTEPSEEVKVCLVLSVSGSEQFSVLTSAVNSDAQDGIDYVAGQVEFTFAAGSRIACTFFGIIDDNISENLIETFIIQINRVAPNNLDAQIGNTSSTTVTIIDDDDLQVFFEESDYRIFENDGPLQVCLVLNYETDMSFIADIQIRESDNQEAIDGEDFTSDNFSVTFKPGSQRECIEVDIVNDDSFETPFEEIFIVEVTSEVPNLYRATVGFNSEASVHIIDDDMIRVHISQSEYSVNEKDGSVTVCITKDDQTTDPITVSLMTRPGTAIPGMDYTPVNTMLSILPEESMVCVDIPITDDSLALEGDETFDVTITSQLLVSADMTPSIVTITDNDVVTFSFRSRHYTFSEGRSSGTIYIDKTGDIAQSIALMISGSLQEGGLIDQIVTFMPSDTEISINFAIIDDTIAQDPPETLTWTLTRITQAESASVEPFNRTTIEIQDNGDVQFTFEFAHYEFSEDIEVATVHINKLGDTYRNITLMLSQSMQGGSRIDQIVTFPRWDTQIPINFAVIDDLTALEPSEFLYWTLTLISPVDRVSVQPYDMATIEIVDNDNTLITFRCPRYVFVEDISLASIFIDKIRDTSQDITLMLSGSLQKGNRIDQNVTFTPPDTEIAISFTVINDLTALEPIKSFDWTLEPITWVDRVNIQPFNMTTVEIVNEKNIIVSLEQKTLSVGENARMEEMCIRIIWGMTLRDVVVDVDYENGNAKNGEDYIADPRMFTISPGVDSICFNISIVDDDRYELDEDFFVVIDISDSKAVIDIKTTTVSILDEEILTIGWEFSEYSVREDNNEIEICAVISNGTTQAISLPTIDILTTEDSATTRDYGDRPIPQFFNFKPGNTTRMCTKITIAMDGTLEPTESFFADLADLPTPRVVYDPKRTTIVIENIDEATIGFGRNSYTARESWGSIFLFANTIRGNLASNVVLRFNLIDGSATAVEPVDYQYRGDSLFSFNHGRRYMYILIEDDQIAENLEEFFCTLECNLDKLTIMSNKTRVEIIDNDVPMIGFEMNHYDAVEDNFVFTEVCAQASSLEKTVSVFLRTFDRTAQAPMDYTSLTTTLVFSPKNRRLCVQIITKEDEVVEGLEYFSVTLFSNISVDFSPFNSASIKIVDKKFVYIQFNQPHFLFRESDGIGTIEVVKVGVSVAPIKVKVTGGPSNQSGIAVSAEAINETIQFPAEGSNNVSISVSFRINSDDFNDEDIEMYTVFLELCSSVGNVLLGDQETTDIMILDDSNLNVECFASVDCSGNSTGMALPYDCCTHGVPPFGVMYMVEGYDECFDCPVDFGFVQDKLTAVESTNNYSVDLAFFSGKADGEFFIDVQYTAASASESDVDILSSRVLVPEVIQQNEIQCIKKEILLVLDQVSQEMDEVFILGFDLDDDKKLGGRPILRNRLDGVIIDATVVTITLSDELSTVLEDEPMPIFISKDVTFLATSVTLRIMPFTLDEAKSRGLEIPQETHFSSNQADERDFGEAALITLLTDEDSDFEIDFTAFIEILDDDVDEAETQFFVVYLDLVDSVNNALIHFSQRISVCQIIDNDDVFIGFQLNAYDYVEPSEKVLKVSDIVLQKTTTSLTEQTYGLKLIFSDPTTEIEIAKLREQGQIDGFDYSLVNAAKQTILLTFEPNETKAIIELFVFADQQSEGVEGFLLNVESQGAPYPNISLQSVNSQPYPSTLVRIFDANITNALYADVSFKEGNYTVNENDTKVEVCVEINIEQANTSNDFGVRVSYTTTSITANNLDYEEVKSPEYTFTFYFNISTTILKCFDVMILQDSYYESTESFLVNLNLNQGLDGVTLSHPTTEIFLLDDDEVAIGFTDEYYHVIEGKAELEIMNMELLQADVYVSITLTNLNDNKEIYILNTTINLNNVSLLLTIDDEVFEVNSDWKVVLSFSEGYQPPLLSIIANTTVVTIENDDTITFCSSSVMFESEKVQNLSIKLYEGIIGDLKINLTIAINDSSSNAFVGEDVTGIPPTTLCYSNGTLSNNISIEIINDMLPEFQENLKVDILIVTAIDSLGTESDITYEVGNHIIMNGDVFIRDRVFASFKTDLYVVNEESDQVILEIIKHGETTADTVSVIVQTIDNSASSVGMFDQESANNKDYVNITMELVFLPDEYQKVVIIDITNDDIIESSENFTAVIVENLMDCQEVSITTFPATSIIIIEDNDRVHNKTSTIIPTITGTTIAIIITLVVVISLSAAIAMIVGLLIIKYRRQANDKTPSTNENETYATIDDLGQSVVTSEQNNDYEVISQNDTSLSTGQAVYEDIDNLEDGAGYESIPEGTTSAISNGYVNNIWSNMQSVIQVSETADETADHT